MKDLSKIIQEAVVAKTNTLRFDCNNFMNAGIRNSDKFEAIKLLKIIFDWRLSTLKSIVERVQAGEDFLDVTNDLNVNGQLQ